jgi:hypothetical protein
MDEKFKTVNIKTAIARLPNPKAYPPNVVTVMVGKLKYTFEKTKDEWFFKI